jgi:hypothetical protein
MRQARSKKRVPERTVPPGRITRRFDAEPTEGVLHLTASELEPVLHRVGTPMVRPSAFLGAARAQTRCAFARNLFDPRHGGVRQSLGDLEEDAEQEIGRERLEAGQSHEASQAREPMNPLALCLRGAVRGGSGAASGRLPVVGHFPSPKSPGNGVHVHNGIADARTCAVRIGPK